MKKVFAICLLTFLIANVAGFYLYSYFRLMEIKKEMRTELLRTSPALFEKIVLSRHQYQQAREGDDELEWHAKMYDIAFIKSYGDQIEILALADDKETDLLKLMSNLLTAATQDSKAPPSALLHYLSLTFTPPDFTRHSSTRSFIAIDHRTPYLDRVSDFCSEIVSPPPRG